MNEDRRAKELVLGFAFGLLSMLGTGLWLMIGIASAAPGMISSIATAPFNPYFDAAASFSFVLGLILVVVIATYGAFLAGIVIVRKLFGLMEKTEPMDVKS